MSIKDMDNPLDNYRVRVLQEERPFSGEPFEMQEWGDFDPSAGDTLWVGLGNMKEAAEDYMEAQHKEAPGEVFPRDGDSVTVEMKDKAGGPSRFFHVEMNMVPEFSSAEVYRFEVVGLPGDPDEVFIGTSWHPACFISDLFNSFTSRRQYTLREILAKHGVGGVYSDVAAVHDKHRGKSWMVRYNIQEYGNESSSYARLIKVNCEEVSTGS